MAPQRHGEHGAAHVWKRLHSPLLFPFGLLFFGFVTPVIAEQLHTTRYWTQFSREAGRFELWLLDPAFELTQELFAKNRYFKPPPDHNLEDVPDSFSIKSQISWGGLPAGVTIDPPPEYLPSVISVSPW